MAQSQCPVCYAPLEVRDVTPCFICGGWAVTVEKFRPDAEYREWRMPGGQMIVLCSPCEVVEFMVPGGWGYRLGLTKRRLAVIELERVRLIEQPQLGRDKFCPSCKLRLSFLKIVAGFPSAAEQRKTDNG